MVWFYPYPTHRIILLAVSPSVQLFSGVIPTLVLPISLSYWLFHPLVHLFSGMVPTLVLPISLSYCLCHLLSIYLVLWFLPLSYPSNHPTGCATLCPFIEWCGSYPYQTHQIILLAVSPSVHLLNGVVPTLILPIESSYWLCHPLSIYWMVWFLPLSCPSNHLTGCVTLCPVI